jgi:hypothetical protein
MSDQLATVPQQLLVEVEQFISNHRGITFREAESAVVALRNYRSEGAILYQRDMERIGKLEEELRLMHEKLSGVSGGLD